MTSAPALWTANRKLALRIANDFYLPGHERQDVEQEALIGLWIASRRWDRDRNPNFKPYAAMVVRGHLITQLKRCRREKHLVLTNAVRDDHVAGEDGDQLTLLETIEAPCHADDLAFYRAELQRIAHAALTEIELEAVSRVFVGMGCSETRLCNALNRARRKMREAA